MDDIFVGSLMTSPVTTVSADTPAKTAAATMIEDGISSVVVVDEAVADHMTAEVVTTTVHESVEGIADRLIEHGIHHVPVVDDTEGVVGMVTTTDLTAYLSGSVDSKTTRAWT